MNPSESEALNEPHEESTPQEEVLVNETTSQIEELKAKAGELNDKYLRLYSEFDNFRKRTAKEKIEWMQTAGEDVFKSVLPILDDFDRAIKSNNETTDIAAVKDGMNLIFNKFKSTLHQKGLVEMNTVGETFDGDVHEAITNTPAPSDDLKGKVVEEVEKGYRLNGKIIRFAKVIIGS